MEDEPRRGGLGALIAAKVVCCGGMILVITGGLSLNAIGAWLLDGGLAWLALAAVFLVAGVWLWRRRETTEFELPTMAEATRAELGLERIDRTKASYGSDATPRSALSPNGPSERGDHEPQEPRRSPRPDRRA